MYDLRQLRDNLDSIRKRLGRRGADVPWDEMKKLVEERRSLTTQVEQLRHELKKGSDDVARLVYADWLTENGHDDRAEQPQPVTATLGPRFYDWQLSQDAAESWRECELHARNLLGVEGFEKLKAELEGRDIPTSTKATIATKGGKAGSKSTLKGGKAPEPNLFGN